MAVIASSGKGNVSFPGSSSCSSISLSLTARYASSWETWDGIRELVQNWHDGLFSCLENYAGNSQRPETEWVSSRIDFKRTTDHVRNMFAYTAFTNPIGRGNSPAQELGKIIYCSSNGRLYLVNNNTKLLRKILLLGFSQKANNKEVIGQFGEGLKVGALALVREGRTVTMETSKDRWRFGLKMDEMFNEEVLTVFVHNRQEVDESESPLLALDLKEDDTCVTVARLTEEEWETFVKRFLFLSPPSDFIKTEMGTLLLDKNYGGQLHVKGVWVSNLSKDGLASGVDFFQLKIDRDRRAVIHRSDIDHQVSGMWVRAIEQRPDLIHRYYQLLQEDKSADVKHAASYLSSSQALSLVADRFFELHGRNAYPVSNSTSFDNLMYIKNELQLKITLCNQSLLNILYNSGSIQPLDDLLSKTREQTALIPFAHLTDQEISILRHAQELLKIVRPTFSLGFVNISDAKNTEIKLKHNKWYQLPRCLLDSAYIHREFFQFCDGFENCKCCAAFVCQGILMLRDCTGCVSKNPEGELVQVESIPESQILFAQLIASLSAQACGQNLPFCSNLHVQSPSNRDGRSDHQLCEVREEALLKQNEKLQQEMSDTDQQHVQDLRKFETQITRLEKEMTRQEVKFANVEQQLNNNWQKQLSKIEHRNSSLEKDIVELKREIGHLQGKLQSAETQVTQGTKVHLRQMKLLQDKCQAQREHLAERFQQLSLFIDSSNSDDKDQIRSLAAKLVKEVREMDQKDVCVVCVAEKPNCVLLPCRHHVTCISCADRLDTCPYCRTSIRDRISTYE